MNKIFLADYAEELIEIAERLDYILVQYESEDADLIKPARKIESSLVAYINKITPALED